MRVISLYPNFANTGGAQNVLLQVAEFFCDAEERPVVVSGTPLQNIPKIYCSRATFLPFSFGTLRRLSGRETVFLSHSRKYTSLLCIMQKAGLLRGSKIVHVAHSLFFDKKKTTFFPRHVIAVSNAVKDNLVTEFGVPERNITVIHNGIKDSLNTHLIPRKPDRVIKILLAGRIEKVKQQVALVENLRGHMPSNVLIYFAGTGVDEKKLVEAIGTDNSFVYTGQLDLNKEIYNYDYMLLFSEKEGLPLSLIEGCMYAKPLISNTVPSVLEINKDGYTGYVFNDFEALAQGLHSLAVPGTDEYIRLSKNSREQYLKSFSEEDMKRSYISYLAEI